MQPEPELPSICAGWPTCLMSVADEATRLNIYQRLAAIRKESDLGRWWMSLDRRNAAGGAQTLTW